jgi:hypothetical protein
MPSMADIERIRTLLEDVEMVARIPPERGGVRLAVTDRCAIAAIRQRFDDRKRRGSVRTLSDEQVAKLKRIHERADL